MYTTFFRREYKYSQYTQEYSETQNGIQSQQFLWKKNKCTISKALQ